MIVEDLLELLYPRTCVGCGEPWGVATHLTEGVDGVLCARCLAGVIPIGRRGCRTCGGEPIRPLASRPSRCRRCRRRRFCFRRGVAAVRYSGPVREGMVRFKFHHRREFGVWLAHRLAFALGETGGGRRCEIVTAVPLHPLRRMIRGFDQAEFIGRRVAKEIGRPYVRGAIVRVKRTLPQSKAIPGRRHMGPRNAFRAGWRRHRVKGKRVLLIDDVMSTGATLDEAARALLAAGAIVVEIGVGAT